MDYLFSNMQELQQAKQIVIHCDDSLIDKHRLSALYISGLLANEPVTGGTYQSTVAELTSLVKNDPHTFDRLATLSGVLFSTYETDDTTLHIYPDLLLSRSAYETIRERLDEIDFNTNY